ncbi:MAG TPA: hypothetical protein PLR74_12200 [Agriterribacter sp.]|nr:hypothetical protein [Agriterribacter sp.]
MKSNTGERERFQKPFSFLSNAKAGLPAALQAVFQNFGPGDFISRLNRWQRMSLTNDQSAYDAAAAREDLMDVTDALKKLVECWHIISTKQLLKKARAQNKHKRLQQKMPEQYGIACTLTKDEQAKPMLFLRSFCRTFNRGYIETELLDMLDAVITYDGVNENDKGNLVFFYRHLHFLVRLSYRINKAKLNHSKQIQYAQ